MFHVTLESFAVRALEDGLDHLCFPGSSDYQPEDAPKGNYLWGSVNQAIAYSAHLESEHGGRYALLAVNTAGLDLHPDPFYDREPPVELIRFGGSALPHDAWFTPAPIEAGRLSLVS
jgi:hypothetical protein